MAYRSIMRNYGKGGSSKNAKKKKQAGEEAKQPMSVIYVSLQTRAWITTKYQYMTSDGTRHLKEAIGKSHRHLLPPDADPPTNTTNHHGHLKPLGALSMDHYYPTIVAEINST